MTGVSVLISNPSACITKISDDIWVISGSSAKQISKNLDCSTEFRSVVSTVFTLPGEHSLLKISKNKYRSLIQAYRGITSSYEVFHFLNNRGEFVVSDHFRNCLAKLPLDQRKVPPKSIVNHLLFRTCPTETYVDRISRLGNGELLRYESNGTVETEIVETLQPEDRVNNAMTAVDEIDGALSKILGSLREEDNIATMLSGGIDSTLLHTYLPSSTPSVSAAFDSPEFEFEREYALQASDILETDHTLFLKDETEYLPLLEATIDALGLPPHHLQTVHMDIAFKESAAEVYLNGQFADALFGLANAKYAYIAWLLRHVYLLIPPAGRLASLKQFVRELKRRPSDPLGRALKFATYTDWRLVQEIVDSSQIERRQHDRLDYVCDRVQLMPEANNHDVHMDWGHWIDYFCDDAVSLWRQLAYARGKELIAPFAGRALAECSISIPVEMRYRRFLEQKYLLKRLLAQRLPEYSTGKPKGGGGLPLVRYINEGPLSTVFEKYEPPKFASEGIVSKSLREGHELAWNLMTFAIWRDRVLTNPDISPIDGSTVIEI